MTAAIGVAVGLGMLGVAILSTITAFIVLAVIRKWENKIDQKPTSEGKD